MRRTKSICALASTLLCSIIIATPSSAQLSKNPDKFLGNITTRYQVDAGGGVPAYYTLWNQITPENESKWGSVEGTRGRFNWGSDTPFNYAKNHNFTYKFHALVWGAQYPNWFSSSLSVTERYNAIVTWFDEVKKHYPDLPMIDVVNEAVGMHQQGNPLMKESLGGGGKTGYDWLIKAFEMAHERWPNAILIYNDYNTFQHDTDNYIDLVRTLRDAGAPIDAYGCQSHDVDNISKSNLQSSMKKIQDAVKIPMYITELDINVEDDAQQKAQYQSIFPVMWEADYCAGVTIWGYVYGATWVDHSGLYKDGAERPAMTWLKSYMASDAAKNAKSPFPGGKKQISLYIKPASIKATRGEALDITVRATMVDKNKSIDSVKLYVKGVLDTIMTDPPYTAKYVPTVNGKHDLKAIAYANDGKTYTREGSFTAYNPRSPYKTLSIPGTIQAEDFDKGGDGITYHDSNSNKEGDASSYRSDCEGVDIVNGNGGRAIGYTNTDEWLEYTVNVTQAGYYTYQAVASSGTTGSGFRLSLSDYDGLTDLTENISVPQTASSDWSKYTTISGRTLIPLKEGEQVIRLTITGNSCNIDKIVFKYVEVDKNLNVKITAKPAPATVNETTTLSVDAVNSAKVEDIVKLNVYANGKLAKTATYEEIVNKKKKVVIDGKISTESSAGHFKIPYKPTAKGTTVITAIALDSAGRESDIARYSLTVRNQRKSYVSNPVVPGTIQAENFDLGGEGFTFHDSDSEDEGKANYRSDNEGVDIVTGNGGYALGYTANNEWYEYTVKVSPAGKYSYSAIVSSGNDNTGFNIGVVKDGKVTNLCKVNVPNTGSWDTYQTVSGNLGNLDEGTQILRITINGAYCNIDKIRFTCTVDVDYITQDDIDAQGTRYNLGGAIVDDNYNGIIIKNGKKYLNMK